jgi:DNA-binding transcriptional regulator YiaG
MKYLIKSASPEAIYFAIVKAMSKLSPVIEQLKRWRTTNGLTQVEAIEVLRSKGLPVSLDTLQNWEIGRNTPRGLAAVALSDFLAQHPKITTK